jgi:pimeloyl-ACP methyl ester carboxylesterase
MAAPAPSVAGWRGRALLIAATGPDAMVTDALRARLRADLGDHLREEAIGAGHMLFWDAPGELGRLLRGFLA